jgi:soluble lytic murein transglycosylase-like protein
MNSNTRTTIKISALFYMSLFIGVDAKADKQIYKYQSKSGVLSFSDIQPQEVSYTLLKVDCYACNVNSLTDWYHTPLNKLSFKDTINKLSQRYRVDSALIRAVIHAESHFKPDALSKVGAQGLMQLMPATAKELGVVDAFIPEQNITGGVRHLAKLLRKYHGDISLVAAAYNAGEGNVAKYGGIPPFEETKVYIQRVNILHKRYARI